MPSDETTVPDPPESAATADDGEVFFVLSGDGIVSGFSAEARAWWHAESILALKGRPFDGLFYEPAPVEGAPKDATWARMREAGPDGLRLRARVRGGGGFAAQVRLSPLDGGIGAARHLARVSRDAAPAIAPAPAPVATTAPGRPGEPLPELAEAELAFFEIDHAAGVARLRAGPGWSAGFAEAGPVETPEHLLERIHPEDTRAVPAAGARGRPGSRGPFRAEVRLRHGAEGWRWIELVGVEVFGELGRLERVVGVMVDAQERREAEEAMAVSEDRFLALTARGRAAYFEIDPDADAAWYSPEFHHLVGHPAGALGATADGFLRLLAPEDAEAGAEAFFESALAEAAGMTSRFSLRHRDGRLLEVEAYLVARRGRDGRIQSVCGLAATGGAATENGGDLPTAVAFAALDAVAEAVVVVDAARRILHLNDKALALAGGGAAPGRLLEECFPLVDLASGAPAPDFVARVVERGDALALDHGYGLAGEPPVEVVLGCGAFLDARGRRVGAIVVLRDPGAMPLSPAELLSSNRMELLGRLACGVAYDFNNLLTTIGGGVALALEQRAWEPLEAVNKATLAAKHLTGQMLSFAGGRAPRRRPCALGPLLRDTARMAGAGSPTAIELEIADDLYPIHGDTTQLVQLFTNLLVNAIQAMPEGGRVAVRAFNAPLARVNSVGLPPGDYARVDVQDNGPGVAPEDLARIFEPFFSTRREGSGLGLSMARSILQQHDGAIEAASTPGSGATFTVYLPRAFKEPERETPAPAAFATGSGRVLVLDDDPDLCMIARGMLELVGYEADAVQSAAEAIALFRKQIGIGRPYAAVILDLTLPGGPGGREVLEELRAITPGVRAIVSSGHAGGEETGHYLAMGFAGVLAKPYRSGDVARVLKEVLAR